MNGSNAITAKQMARFTFVAQTGVGIITIPAVLAKDIGHDGWISMLATGIAAIVVSALIVVLLRRYKDLSILDINKLLYGKIAGTVLNILLFLYLLSISSGITRAFIIFLRITLFPTTPPLIMTPFVLFPSLYMVWQGLKTTARFKATTMMAYAFVLIYVVLIYKEIKISFLMPIGEAGVLPILSSMRKSFFSYIGLELISVFFSEISDKEKALKWHVIANLSSMLFFTLVVAVCTAVFGEDLLKDQVLALFNLSRIYNAPILERVDLYMISIWFLAMGCCIRAYIMAGYYSISKILNKEKNKYIYGLFILALIILSRIPNDLNDTFKALEYVNYAGFAVVGFLILCLVISMFKKNGVKNDESQG